MRKLRLHKYNGNLKGVDFLRAINANKGYTSCFNCPHPNGECETFARAGSCKAYDKVWKNI